VQFFWGPDTKNYQSPDVLDFPLFTLFGQEFSAYRGFMIGISVLIFIGLYRLLTRSRVGIIIQAAITHPHTGGQSRSQRAANFYGVFGIGSALAGVAGVIAGPVLTTFPGMAAVLGSIVFVIVVIGGLGSLAGALIASLLIGLLQSYAIASNLGVAIS
jgi:branched-chain amino acid transport system permease protein